MSSLPERILVLERQRSMMNMANRYARKGHRAGLLGLGYAIDQVEQLLQPNAVGEVGFSAKQLEELTEKIKRLRKRLVAERRRA